MLPFFSAWMVQGSAWWGRLTEPSAAMQDAALRRQSRLVASLLLTMLVVICVTWIAPLYTPERFTLLGSAVRLSCMALALGLYLLNRRGQTLMAVRVMVLSWSAIIFIWAYISQGTAITDTLNYLVGAAVLCMLLLSLRATVALMIAHVIGIIAFATLDPRFTIGAVLVGPIGLNVVLTVVVIIPIGYYRRLEAQQRQQIEASEARYRELLDNIDDFVYTLSPTADLLSISAGMTRLGGWSDAEVLSRPFIEFIHPADVALGMDMFLRMARGEVPPTYELRCRKKSGDYLWIEFNSRPIMERGAFIGVSGMARNITERKRDEAHDLKLAVERERTRLLERFIQAVSHDFRTSLAGIESSRYLIQRLLSPVDRVRLKTKLENMQQFVFHLADQLDNLYLLSSLSEFYPTPCDLNLVVEMAIASLTEAAEEKRQTIHFEPGVDLPETTLAEADVAQAVRQLLSNAVHHTPVGGSIKLRTYCQNGEVMIEVRDSGAGIDPNHLPHIFDPFYRADPARTVASGGIGLGLTIARMVAEMHGGSLSVASESGKGSTFTLALPIMPRTVISVSPRPSHPLSTG